MPKKLYASYASVVQAHTVAMQHRWIARLGYDQQRGEFWIEYVGKTS
jgi:hypothetical protein